MKIYFVCSVRIYFVYSVRIYFVRSVRIYLVCSAFCKMCNLLLYGGILPGERCPLWASVAINRIASFDFQCVAKNSVKLCFKMKFFQDSIHFFADSISIKIERH